MSRFALLLAAVLVSGGCAGPADGPQTDASAPVEAPVAPAPVAGGGGMGPAELPGEETLDDDPDPAAGRLAELRAAAERDPQDPEAHRRLGAVLGRLGRDEEGMRHLERAAALAPDDPGVLLSLGLAHSGAGRLEQAEAAYLRLLEVSPEDPKALNNLGNLAIRRGDEARAIGMYRRAVAADPDYLLAHYRLANVLHYYGHDDEAEGVYARVLGMKPAGGREAEALVSSLYRLASIHLSRGEAERAERELAEVLRYSPAHPSAHYGRAQALLMLGREEEARQELETHALLLSKRPATGPTATSQ